MAAQCDRREHDVADDPARLVSHERDDRSDLVAQCINKIASAAVSNADRFTALTKARSSCCSARTITDVTTMYDV